MLGEPRWTASLCGIGLGGGLLWGVAEGYHWLTGREGMGGGDIKLLGADCAEEFEIVEGEAPVEPGTVMVIEEGNSLQVSFSAYDRRVAGVVSGAGDYRPGIVLGRLSTHARRHAIALVGKAFCKVDARYSPIRVGDLLTTSDTPGHAMLAADPSRAFGAVIGKALRPLAEGQGLIPILIALQ